MVADEDGKRLENVAHDSCLTVSDRSEINKKRKTKQNRNGEIGTENDKDGEEIEKGRKRVCA